MSIQSYDEEISVYARDLFYAAISIKQIKL